MAWQNIMLLSALGFVIVYIYEWVKVGILYKDSHPIVKICIRQKMWKIVNHTPVGFALVCLLLSFI